MNIRPSEAQIAEYQRLLRSEWNKDLAREVVALVGSLIPESQQESVQSVWSLFDPKLNGSLPSDAISEMITRLAGFVEYAHLPELPEFPESYEAPRRATKLLRETAQLTACLTLHSLAQLKDDIGFIRDIQSLAFYAALHFTLPALRERHESEHSILLHAMSMFAHEYFFLDPGHYCYLRSLIFGYLGNAGDRIKYLSFALGLTPLDDHSYLTKAQEYWSELLDNERVEEAETFLLALYRSSPTERQSEVREMIDSAFRFIVAENLNA